MNKLKDFKKLLLLACILILSSPAVFAAEHEIVNAQSGQESSVYSLSLGTEMMTGHTTYRLSDPTVLADGTVYNELFPFSELKYPLETTFFRVDGYVKPHKRLKINASFKINMNEPDDNMEDYDWLTPSNPTQLDIYSELPVSDFDAHIFDINMEWTFLQKNKYSVFAGIGYQFQNLDYTTNFLFSSTPSGMYPGYVLSSDGSIPAITYEITYHMPYLLLGSDLLLSDKFTLTGMFTFSPYVKADDEDRHLLRENGGKVSDGDMDGMAFMLDISGKYNFTDRIWLELGFHLTDISVDGTMDQYYVNTGYYASNVLEAESTQTSCYFNIGFDF